MKKKSRQRIPRQAKLIASKASKVKFGTVHLSGLIRSGTTTRDTALLRLSDGYRPSYEPYFVVANYGEVGTLYVATNDYLIISCTLPNNGWLSLDNVSFRVD